jgi:hypothetical protein
MLAFSTLTLWAIPFCDKYFKQGKTLAEYTMFAFLLINPLTATVFYSPDYSHELLWYHYLGYFLLFTLLNKMFCLLNLGLMSKFGWFGA